MEGKGTEHSERCLSSSASPRSADVAEERSERQLSPPLLPFVVVAANDRYPPSVSMVQCMLRQILMSGLG